MPPHCGRRSSAPASKELHEALDKFIKNLPGTDVQKVILFGSLARGTVRSKSDIDLVVIRPTAAPFVHRGADLLGLFPEGTPVDMLVYTPAEWQELSASRDFQKSIRREGSWCTMPGKTPDGERWLRQALQDRDDARFALGGNRFGLACFLSQQAADKALEAFLYHRGAEKVWGHSVGELCRDAATLEPSFAELIHYGANLDKFYLPTRYPDSLPGGIPAGAFDKEDAEKALATAERLIKHAQRFIRGSSSP